MYAPVLGDATFWGFLLQVDRELAERTRHAGCRSCGAPLHSACYGRRPRGLPRGIDPGPEFAVCYSFCCSADGCRRRHQAPSVRFLGRKVYAAAIVLLLCAMRQGPTRRTAGELRSLFGVDRRTLCRWRTWWRTVVPGTEFWRRALGLFRAPVREEDLPQSLIDRFTERGRPRRDVVMATLRFLSGLFGAFGVRRSLMVDSDPQSLGAAAHGSTP